MKRVNREGGQANPRTPFQVGRCCGGQGSVLRGSSEEHREWVSEVCPREERDSVYQAAPTPHHGKVISSSVRVSRGALLVTKEPWGRMVTGASDRCCQMPPGQGWVLQSRVEST